MNPIGRHQQKRDKISVIEGDFVKKRFDTSIV